MNLENRIRRTSESPIEEHLAWELERWKAPEVQVEPQIGIRGYRMDFGVTRVGCQTIGLECDGKRFHDRFADRPRERHILSSGAVRRIYRFPGTLLVRMPEACLAVVAELDPWVFRSKSLVNLATYAERYVEHDEAVAFHPGERQWLIRWREDWGAEEDRRGAWVTVISRYGERTWSRIEGVGTTTGVDAVGFRERGEG